MSVLGSVLPRGREPSLPARVDPCPPVTRIQAGPGGAAGIRVPLTRIPAEPAFAVSPEVVRGVWRVWHVGPPGCVTSAGWRRGHHAVTRMKHAHTPACRR